LWDIEDGREQNVFANAGTVIFTSNGKSVVIHNNHHLELRSIPANQELFSISIAAPDHIGSWSISSDDK
jgi:hypothetical protein